MRTIEVDVIVTEQGKGIVELPPDIEPGEHKGTLTFKEGLSGEQKDKAKGEIEFLVLDLGPWPENLSLRREDMYDEWGR